MMVKFFATDLHFLMTVFGLLFFRFTDWKIDFSGKDFKRLPGKDIGNWIENKGPILIQILEKKITSSSPSVWDQSTHIGSYYFNLS